MILLDNIRKFAKRKDNKYDLSGNYGVGYTLKGEEFYFDLEDYDLIKDYCWHKDAHGYISCKNNGKRILLHRLLMNINEPKIMIDHINHIIIDNRKSNMRIVNKSQNAMNHNILRNNTSGVTGISQRKDNKKWRARITVNNNNIYLGQFDSFEDAIKARKEAEEKYFGEFSYDNSMALNS